MAQTTLLDLHPNKDSEGLCYPSAVTLDRFFASCDTFNGLSNGVYIQKKKTEDLNVHVFNIITKINE